jgi:transmembrane sensor
MTNIPENEKARSLLQKYRAGQCTPEEEARVLQWFEALGSATPIPHESDTDQAVQHMAPRIMQAIRRDQSIRKRMLFLRASIAALLIIVTGILILKPAQKPITWQITSTSNGEKKEITLPDGSTVFMNAASQLKIPSDYGVKNRTVQLTGEGFFSIKHDPQHPFQVHANKILTEVLGTSFNINAYANTGKIKVAVRTGKVKVNEQVANTNVVLAAGLTPNQVLEYATASREYNVKNTDASQFIAWKEDILYFEEASIHEIAATLERRFNVHVEVAGSSGKNCRYTIRFKKQTLPQVLKVLETLSGITWKSQNGQILINPKNCF